MIDYGFAHVSFKLDGPNPALGTPGYLAPELFFDYTTVDLRYCDVFAIGVVAMSLLLGHPVFRGNDLGGSESTIDRILAENKACKLDWIMVSEKLTTTGISSLQALLHPDPRFRPLAEDALRLPWFDVAFEHCVPIAVPEKASRRLARLV